MMESWNNLGAPLDGSVIPAVVILDPNPGAAYGAEAELQAFARGWNDHLPFNEFTGYGSRYSLDLAGQVAPKMTRRWGVGTWGYGESGNGSLPPNVPADMIQHGNLEAPVLGTDYNTIFRVDMGQWGGSSANKKKEESYMWIALAVWLDGVHAFKVGAGGILWEYPRDSFGAYGIPQAALDDAHNYGFVLDNLTAKPAWDGVGTAWDRLVRMTKASETMPIGGGTSNTDPNLIRTIVRDELNKTKLSG
jgi:hypothetical protein